MKLEQIIAVRAAKTLYRYEDMAVKVFNKDYSKADVLNEALNSARVEETGLRIPKIIEVGKIDDKWAIFSEYIEGKTLAQHMAESPAKRSEYLEMFVDIQLDIHSRRAPLLNKLHDKMNRKISESNFDATTRYDLHTRLAGMPKHKKVCHGDFNPSNIIIGENNVPYLIDWAHATQGNASADAARSYLLFMLADDAKTADAYLDLFCTKSDTAKQYVQKWLSIVAASQSVKGHEHEQELLKRWVHVVDYE